MKPITILLAIILLSSCNDANNNNERQVRYATYTDSIGQASVIKKSWLNCYFKYKNESYLDSAYHYQYKEQYYYYTRLSGDYVLVKEKEDYSNEDCICDSLYKTKK